MSDAYLLMVLPWIFYFFLMYFFRCRLLGEFKEINHRLLQLEDRVRREAND
ncbi:hypothetical protein PAP_07425 [Palaeococcus pacificus DY20341]|uniref:Uncharacterized protein n=1 Tax=Palaeococcus pacificus DY20341 TaxID=1343739 RepID=A0A075LSZ1_9EURY|nr:hypothetical protein [Palaeococcus pacificus]AIF69875.1 hypothetical protein PAP_07425 [Palaeococcus pacificus DY20341]